MDSWTIFLPDVLDGAAIVVAMFVLNAFHPGMLLGKAHTWREGSVNEVNHESGLKKPDGTDEVYSV